MSEVYQKFISQKIVRRKKVLDYFSGDVDKTNAALRWLIESAKALRIKNGLYYFKQPDEWFKEQVSISPWLIAANAVEGSVIAYHSALRLLGTAYSETKEIQIAVGLERSRVPKGFEYQKVNYKYFRSDLSFGITEHIIAEKKIKAFDKERLILEGLMHPDKFYGMAEFLASIEEVKWLDLDHLMDMINKYPLPTVSMRLGWLLHKYRQKWYVDDAYLHRLKTNRPEDRVFLVNRQRKGNVLEKAWNLMVPKTLLSLGK